MGYFIRVNCTNINCPHFNSCCFLPTEVQFSERGKSVDIMIVGQGAGWQEEIYQRPWIGKAGQLLRETLKTIFSETGKISLALSNTVRCHPTEVKFGERKDRPPTNQEIKHCIHFLKADIDLLKPRIVILAGGSAAKAYGHEGSIKSIRGIINEDNTIVTYHPAGVLRSMELMQYMRRDLLSAISYCKENE